MSRAFRLGLFIVASLLILATGVFLIGDRHFLFSPTLRLRTTFKTVSGLDEGAEVRVGGIHAGTVTHIALPSQPDGAMTVEMKLDRHTASVLRADSVASIQTEGLLGSKYVDVAFGSDAAAPLPDNGEIPSTAPLDMSDLMQQANGLLTNVRAGSESLKNIVAKIDRGQGTLGALVNDRSMYTQIDQATSSAKGAATAFQEDMEALKHNFFLRGFFNDRGYEDEATVNQHAIAKLPADKPIRIFSYPVTQIFDDPAKAKLKSPKQLDEAGRYLESTPFGVAVVVTRGGMTGDSADVLLLTQGRASVIRDYLIDHFKMDDAKIRTLGLGKSKPDSDSNGTVEIAVYGPRASAGR